MYIVIEDLSRKCADNIQEVIYAGCRKKACDYAYEMAREEGKYCAVFKLYDLFKADSLSLLGTKAMAEEYEEEGWRLGKKV